MSSNADKILTKPFYALPPLSKLKLSARNDDAKFDALTRNGSPHVIPG